MSLKDNLQKILKSKGWTLARLARETGLPKSTVHSIASVGQTSVNLEHLRKIAASLETSVFELSFGIPDPYEVKSEEILKELFSGDIRVSIHKIERVKPTRR